MTPRPDDDLGAALGLIIEIIAWIEATPESELDFHTAVKWEESIAGALQDMSPTARTRVLDLCEQWRDDGSYVPDEILATIEEALDTSGNP